MKIPDAPAGPSNAATTSAGADGAATVPLPAEFTGAPGAATVPLPAELTGAVGADTLPDPVTCTGAAGLFGGGVAGTTGSGAVGMQLWS
jgi:hypothetical protein